MWSEPKRIRIRENRFTWLNFTLFYLNWASKILSESCEWEIDEILSSPMVFLVIRSMLSAAVSSNWIHKLNNQQHSKPRDMEYHTIFRISYLEWLYFSLNPVGVNLIYRLLMNMLNVVWKCMYHTWCIQTYYSIWYRALYYFSYIQGLLPLQKNWTIRCISTRTHAHTVGIDWEFSLIGDTIEWRTISRVLFVKVIRREKAVGITTK